MLSAILVVFSMVAIFFGSMVVSAGFDLLASRDRKVFNRGGWTYISGMGVLVSACASSYLAGAIS